MLDMVDALWIVGGVAGVVAGLFRATDESGEPRAYVPFVGFDALTGLIGGGAMAYFIVPYGPEWWVMAGIAALVGYVVNDVLCSVAELVSNYRRRLL